MNLPVIAAQYLIAITEMVSWENYWKLGKGPDRAWIGLVDFTVKVCYANMI